MPMHFFHLIINNFEAVVSFVTDRNMRTFLTGSAQVKSVFERLDLRDENGKPYNLRSHAARHYLNTLAHGGRCLPAGYRPLVRSKNFHQNSSDHRMSGTALAKKAREVLKTEAMMGPVVETFKRLPPIEREEFLKARFATAHTTDIGMCFQDWSLAPCHKHGACADCGDHLIIKGNAKQKVRTEQMLLEQKAMLAEAEKEIEEETYGASNYVTHNRKIVAGLEKALTVHSDPSIPDGTLVHPWDLSRRSGRRLRLVSRSRAPKRRHKPLASRRGCAGAAGRGEPDRRSQRRWRRRATDGQLDQVGRKAMRADAGRCAVSMPIARSKAAEIAGRAAVLLQWRCPEMNMSSRSWSRKSRASWIA